MAMFGMSCTTERGSLSYSMDSHGHRTSSWDDLPASASTPTVLCNVLQWAQRDLGLSLTAGLQFDATDPHSPRKKQHMHSGLHCKWHPDAKSHSTKDCRNPGTAVVRTTVSTTATPSTPTKDLSKVECYGCGKMGHYRPDCPHKEQSNKTKIDKPKQGFKTKARAASVKWDKSVPSRK